MGDARTTESGDGIIAVYTASLDRGLESDSAYVVDPEHSKQILPRVEVDPSLGYGPLYKNILLSIGLVEVAQSKSK